MNLIRILKEGDFEDYSNITMLNILMGVALPLLIIVLSMSI